MPDGITPWTAARGETFLTGARTTMSSMPVAEKPLSQPSGLVFTARLLAAIVIFAAVAPGIL
ncbi:MFS transporter, partial [Raoultella planticola]